LGHDVRRVVAQQLEPFGRASRDDLDGRVLVDRPRQVAQLAVDAHGHGVPLEARADAASDAEPVEGRWQRTRGTVGQRDRRHMTKHSWQRAAVGAGPAHCTITVSAVAPEPPMSSLSIHMFPCLADNYGYLLHDA